MKETQLAFCRQDCQVASFTSVGRLYKSRAPELCAAFLSCISSLEDLGFQYLGRPSNQTNWSNRTNRSQSELAEALEAWLEQDQTPLGGHHRSPEAA